MNYFTSLSICLLLKHEDNYVHILVLFRWLNDMIYLHCDIMVSGSSLTGVFWWATDRQITTSLWMLSCAFAQLSIGIVQIMTFDQWFCPAVFLSILQYCTDRLFPVLSRSSLSLSGCLHQLSYMFSSMALLSTGLSFLYQRETAPSWTRVLCGGRRIHFFFHCFIVVYCFYCFDVLIFSHVTFFSFHTTVSATSLIP